MKQLYIMAMALFALNVNAVEVPNTFVSGEAASAAQVNANFTAVAGGVNVNTTEVASVLQRLLDLEAKLTAKLNKEMPIVMTSSGIELGTAIDLSSSLSFLTVINSVNNVVHYNNWKNSTYSAIINSFGQQQATNYDSTNCGGTAYLQVTQNSAAGDMINYLIDDLTTVKTIPTDWAPITAEIFSTLSINGTCSNVQVYNEATNMNEDGSQTATNLILPSSLIDNDPSVTGIPLAADLQGVTIVLSRPTL